MSRLWHRGQGDGLSGLGAEELPTGGLEARVTSEVGEKALLASGEATARVSVCGRGGMVGPKREEGFAIGIAEGKAMAD